MNNLKTITLNILKNISVHRYYNIIKNQNVFRRRFRKVPIYLSVPKFFQISLASAIIPNEKINVEDDLRKAVEEGETSILKLINKLHDLVISVSKEYRSCLTEQIEFIKITGDEASEELPKFRTHASELSSELSEYVILLKTIGEIIYNQSLVTIKVDKDNLQNILRKYKELEILLLHEFEENKRKELELLEVYIANILPA